MKTRDLQTLWWDWLGSAERLLRSLHEQTAALTLRDVERVERIQPELDSMLQHVRQVDEQAAALATKLAGDMGVEPNLRSLVNALDKAEAQQLQAIANRVTVAAGNVQSVLRKNRALMENEMAYVNGTLTLIAKASTEAAGPYAGKRMSRTAAVLVDQAA